jgi:hypothetical protein
MLITSMPGPLEPCRMCPTRMAVPGSALCTVCDAVTVPGSVPDDISGLTSAPTP